MAAPVNSNGVLSALIQQVSDGSPQYSVTASTYTAKFKGPYSILKDANAMVDLQLSAALATLGITVNKEFNFPTPPPNTAWYVTGVNVEQLEAGDHAMLTVNCEARNASLTPSGGGTYDPYQDTWQLRWESYTLKPCAFCSNEQHSDYAWTDPAVQPGSSLPGMASREHIDTFLNGNDKGVDRGHRWYRNDQGSAWFLNDAENVIVDKMLEDKSALWHYPVLTHTTVLNHYVSNISSVISNHTTYNETIGDKIDYIVGGSASPKAAPDGCPYTFPTEPKWIWVKTGDDMQHVKTKGRISFARTETFMGVLSADINYYGDVAFDHSNLSACRWIPGKL